MSIRAYNVITFTTTRISKTQYLTFCILMIESPDVITVFNNQKCTIHYLCQMTFSSGRTTFQILAKLSNGKNVAKHLICGNKVLYSNSMEIEGVHLIACTTKV